MLADRLSLAQDATQSGELFGKVVPWLGALLVLVIVGFSVIWFIRRWMDSDEETPTEKLATLFTISNAKTHDRKTVLGQFRLRDP